jgi:hypothetical protein
VTADQMRFKDGTFVRLKCSEGEVVSAPDAL